MPKGVPNKKLESIEIPEVGVQFQPIFLQALRDILPSLRLHSDDMLIRKIGKDRMDDASLEFLAFMQAGAGNLTKNEQLALSSQLLKCLSKYIQITGCPVTLKTILDHIPLLDTAVNNAFPGYAQSQLLKYTILPIKAA